MNHHSNIKKCPVINDDVYGHNFTIRFLNDEYYEFERVAKEKKIKRTTLIRKALKHYYKKLEADDELLLIDSTPYDLLPKLITGIKTNEGKEALQNKLLKIFQKKREDYENS